MQNPTWYIIKRQNQTCEVISSQELSEIPEASIVKKWGSFDTQGEAIAKRVGLIRAQQCQPL